MAVYTLSQQVDADPAINRDGRLAFKWGGELFYQPFAYAFVALRYDRVVLDVQDEASALRIVSPRSARRSTGCWARRSSYSTRAIGMASGCGCAPARSRLRRFPTTTR